MLSFFFANVETLSVGYELFFVAQIQQDDESQMLQQVEHFVTSKKKVLEPTEQKDQPNTNGFSLVLFWYRKFSNTRRMNRLVAVSLLGRLCWQAAALFFP